MLIGDRTDLGNECVQARLQVLEHDTVCDNAIGKETAQVVVLAPERRNNLTHNKSAESQDSIYFCRVCECDSAPCLTHSTEYQSQKKKNPIVTFWTNLSESAVEVSATDFDFGDVRALHHVVRIRFSLQREGHGGPT